jgi:hypothetical protein
MRRLRRRIYGLIATTLMCGVLAPVAAADQPIREDLPPTSTVFPLACGFPVLAEGVLEKEKALIFDDHAIVTGVLKWRLTNPANSKSIEVNISGPVHSTLTADGTGVVNRFEGRTLFVVGPVLAARLDIEQGLFLSTGPVVVEATFGVGITSITHVGGTWTPLCPELA